MGQRSSQNLIGTDHTLKDLLDLHKKDVMLSMNCVSVATVQTFNSVNQTVTATINYKKTYMEKNAQGQYNPVLKDYPILIDCPVVMLGGGPATLTFPIQQGDECLILFNDRDIDAWFASGQVGPLATQRLHSTADGFALVGVRSLSRSIVGYDQVNVALQNSIAKLLLGPAGVSLLAGAIGMHASPTSTGLNAGTAEVAASTTDLIRIKNNITTLGTVLDGMLTILAGAFQSPTPPTTVPLNSAAGDALNTYKITVDSLLE